MPTISGTVYDDAGLAVAGRTVRVYRRDTGVLVAEGISSDGAGTLGDPFFADVGLLMHMDADFTDVKGATWAANSATVVASPAKFGGGAGQFNGANQRLTAAVYDGVRLPADFTFEWWGYLPALGVSRYVFQSPSNSSADYYVMFSSGNKVQLFQGGFGTRDFTPPTPLAANEWTHFALVRSSGTLRCFVRGELCAESYTVTNSFSPTSGTCYIGNNSGNGFPAGYLDDLRITQAARYAAAFTPPALAFPDILGSGAVLALGEYAIDTVGFSGECNVVCLDDAAGTTYNDLVLRTTPV